MNLTFKSESGSTLPDARGMFEKTAGRHPGNKKWHDIDRFVDLRTRRRSRSIRRRRRNDMVQTDSFNWEQEEENKE